MMESSSYSNILELVDTDATTEASESEVSSDECDDNFRSAKCYPPTLDNFEIKSIECQDCVSKQNFVCEHQNEENFKNVVRIKGLVQKEGQRAIFSNQISPSSIDRKVEDQLPNDIALLFTPVRVKKEGNCFFEAVSIGLTGSDKLSVSLRKCAAYEYIQNRQNYDNYLHKFQHSGTDSTWKRLSENYHYSGEDSAFVLCNAIGRKIVWIQRIELNGNVRFIKESYIPFLSDPRAKPIYVFFNTKERHFSSLLPNASDSFKLKFGNENGDIYPLIPQITFRPFYSAPTYTNDINKECPVPPANLTRFTNAKSLEAYYNQMLIYFKNTLAHLLQSESNNELNDEIIQKLIMTFFEKGHREDFVQVMRSTVRKNLNKSEMNTLYLKLLRFALLPENKSKAFKVLEELRCPTRFLPQLHSLPAPCNAQIDIAVGNTPAQSNLKEEEKSCEIDSEIDEVHLITETIINFYDMKQEDLSFKPEKCFEINIPFELVLKMYDFKTKTFIPGAWPFVVESCFHRKGIPCGLTSQSGIYYYSKLSSAFCRLRAECGCGMEYRIILFRRPAKGRDLKAKVICEGEFNLIQHKNCSRPISSVLRIELAEKLQNCKAHSTYLSNCHTLEGRRVLHNNPTQKSSNVLRVMKSEGKTKDIKSKSLCDQVVGLQLDYQNSVHPEKPLQGFIHLNSGGSVIQIHTYDYGSLSLHRTQLMRRKSLVTVHLDATSGLFKNPNSKQLLVFHLRGCTDKGIAYPIAEMISQSGNNVAVSGFLSTVFIEMNNLFPSTKRPLADIVVSDFSYALLHGISIGLNHENLTDYIVRSQSLWTTAARPWPMNKCVIFICTSHLLNAFKLNLLKRIPPSPKRSKIVVLALHAIARLQECRNWNEFLGVVDDILTMFESKNISKANLEKYSEKLKSKQSQDLVMKASEQMEADMDFEEFVPGETLKSTSIFYNEFRTRRSRFDPFSYSSEQENDYYCPTVVDCLLKYKMSMFSFWNCAVARTVKNSSFLRETNAVIESYFGVLKKTLGFSPDYSHVEYLREIYKYHNGEVVSVLMRTKDAICSNRLPAENNPKDENKLLKKEQWKKRKAGSPGVHNCKYLTPKSAKVEVNTGLISSKAVSQVGSLKLPENEKIVDNWEENENDFKVYECEDGSFLTRKQLLGILRGGLVEFSQMKAYSDLLQQRKTPMVVVVSPVAIFKIGEVWDGQIKNSELSHRFNLPKNKYHYLIPLFYTNHWLLIHLHVRLKKAVLIDSGSVACTRTEDIEKNCISLLLDHLNLDKTGWKILVNEEAPMQTDAINCGIHVLSNMRALLEDLDEPCFKKRITNERLNFSINLLNSTPLGKQLVDKAGYNLPKLIEAIEDI